MNTILPRSQILYIEPASHTPEIDSFNYLSRLSQLPLTYHLPTLYGFESLAVVDPSTVAGILLMGSDASVNERLPWPKKLENWLTDLWGSQIPTLGICYGHQMIANLFGGKVDFAFAGQALRRGFRRLKIIVPPKWYPEPREITLCVSHREAVVTCPAKMNIMACSEEVPIDGLAHSELPIWSVQAHPEATPLFLPRHDISPLADPGQLNDGHAFLAAFLNFCAKNAANPS